MSADGISRGELSNIPVIKQDIRQQERQKNEILSARNVAIFGALVLMLLAAGLGGYQMADHINEMDSAYFIGGAISTVLGFVVPLTIIRLALLSSRESITQHKKDMEAFKAECLDMEEVAKLIMLEEDYDSEFMDDLEERQVKPFVHGFCALALRTTDVGDRGKLKTMLKDMLESDKVQEKEELELIRQLGGDKEFLELLLPEIPTRDDMALLEEASKKHKAVFAKVVSEAENYATNLTVLELVYKAGALDPKLVRKHARPILVQLHAYIPHKPMTLFQRCLIHCIADDPTLVEGIARDMHLDPKVRLALAHALDFSQKGSADCMKALMCKNVFDPQPENREMLGLVVDFLSDQDDGEVKAANWLANRLVENGGSIDSDTLQFIAKNNLLFPVLVGLSKPDATKVANFMNDNSVDFQIGALEELAQAMIHHGVVLNKAAKPQLRTWLTDKNVTLPDDLTHDIELVMAVGLAFPEKLIALDLPRKIALLKALPENFNLQLIHDLLPDNPNALGNQLGIIAKRYPLVFMNKMASTPTYVDGKIFIEYRKAGELGNLLGLMKEHLPNDFIRVINGIIATYVPHKPSGRHNLTDEEERVLLGVSALKNLNLKHRLQIALRCDPYGFFMSLNDINDSSTISNLLLNSAKKGVKPYVCALRVLAEDPHFGQEVNKMYLMSNMGAELSRRLEVAQAAYWHMSPQDQTRYPEFAPHTSVTASAAAAAAASPAKK